MQSGHWMRSLTHAHHPTVREGDPAEAHMTHAGNTYIHMHIYTCIHAHTHMHTHTQTHRHMHTHTHTHTQAHAHYPNHVRR